MFEERCNDCVAIDGVDVIMICFQIYNTKEPIYHTFESQSELSVDHIVFVFSIVQGP